jgi:hypothetical protein
MTDKQKEMQEYFQKNNYVVIRNFLDENTTKLFYQYSITRVQQVDFLSMYAKNEYHPNWHGTFGDDQCPNSFSCYGDPLMDTLLLLSTGSIEGYTGLELVPNYSYWRFYQPGEELKRHRDRHSCEISVTICLGYNMDNVDKEKYPDYNWPMWVETTDPETNYEAPIHLNPGDIIVYRGCAVDHWRETFIGNNQAQLFIHYNDKNGPYNILFDGRPLLGIPKKYQRSS